MNPHPPLSGFPIALLVLLGGGELLWLAFPRLNARPVRIFLLSGILLFIPLTYFSGYWGVDAANSAKVFEITAEQISFHQSTSKLLLLSIFPLILFGFLRSATRYSEFRSVRVLYGLTVLLSLILCAVTSNRGGELVFKYGAAVSAEPKLIAHEKD